MNSVTFAAKIIRRATCAVLKARVQLLHARLQAVSARADASTARLQLKAVTKLLVKQRAVERAVAKLAVASAATWGRTRRGIENRVAALEAAVHAAESRFLAE